MYGGYASGIDDIANSTVYVLSLPAFTWQQQNGSISAFSRYLHSCNVIGNRQMVAIGGRVMNSTAPGPNADLTGTTPDISLPDPWGQGLGIFDLTEMVWKNEYDASAAPYMTPAMVKASYQQHGRDPTAGWSNDLVKTWFIAEKGANSTSANVSSTNTSTPTTNGSGSNNAGAIAGGTIGGIAGLALITLLVFFLLRRHRRSKGRSAVPTFDPESKKAELGDGGNNNYYPNEMDAAQAPIEMPQREAATTELPTTLPSRKSSRLLNEK